MGNCKDCRNWYMRICTACDWTTHTKDKRSDKIANKT
jgi:hypothetical protein